MSQPVDQKEQRKTKNRIGRKNQKVKENIVNKKAIKKVNKNKISLSISFYLDTGEENIWIE